VNINLRFWPGWSFVVLLQYYMYWAR